MFCFDFLGSDVEIFHHLTSQENLHTCKLTVFISTVDLHNIKSTKTTAVHHNRSAGDIVF